MRAPRLLWRMSRRHRWIADRKAKGLLRPLPIAGIEVNCKSISAGPREATEILRNAAAAKVLGLPVDIILGSECDDFDASEVLGPEWDVLHNDENEDRDGTMLAIRKPRGHLLNPRYEFGAPALAGAMADRWLAVATLVIDPETKHLWYPKTVATHGPPKRGWVRWPGYMRNVVEQRPDLAAGDWNKLARAVWPALRRKVRMRHILGWAVRWWIPVSDPVAVDVGSDHLAVAVVLWPKR